VDERTKLVQEEDEAWAEIVALISGLTEQQMEEPGLTPAGWSVKDLLWHFCCWTAEAARQLERIRMGTYVERDWDTDSLNDRFFRESQGMSIPLIKTQLAAARSRGLAEWAALPEPTPEAIEWFGESGPIHYREHLPDLRAWVKELTSGA